MTTISKGQEFEVRNITLNANTDTPIDFNQQVNSVTLKCRTSVDILFRRNSNDGNYYTIPAGGTLTLDAALGDSSQGGYIFGWARSASSTPVLEAIGIF